jgi:glutamine cyclotransferase
MKRSTAEVIREYGPYPGVEQVHGVTHDGQQVWFASGDKLNAIDPETGKILRTIESNRFVTGVTWVEGELWHATWEGDESELRRIDPRTGTVVEQLEMPPGMGVSGLESDGRDQFFCGGGGSGKVRAVRRPKRASTAGSG